MRGYDPVLPKGVLKESCEGEPKRFFDVVDNGYVEFYWRKMHEIYMGRIVRLDGKIVYASVISSTGRRITDTKEALEQISNVKSARINVYEVNRNVLIRYLPSEIVKTSPSPTLKSPQFKQSKYKSSKPSKPKPSKPQRRAPTIRVNSVMDYLASLPSNYTGYLRVEFDGGGILDLQIVRGVVRYAKLSYGGDTYYGDVFLTMVDRSGRVTRFDGEIRFSEENTNIPIGSGGIEEINLEMIDRDAEKLAKSIEELKKAIS